MEFKNPAQQEIIESGLLWNGFSTVLNLPTGAGKTYLSERAIEHAVAQGGRAVYLAPLKALAREVTDRWATCFAGVKVGIFTGDYGQPGKPDYPVPFQHAQIYVMTPERFDMVTRTCRDH